ncbi:hypothetical protein FHY55_01235 [Oceanicola sp. D3]|uniref:hypothetical protein n=1 Tax=Oceanicola sp. D3 TaxID=2587163 RepID=UPI0011230E4C|nr:hypothetical protein [Oceanicola sp. D3]QDC07949.1 hypothetical protein FHY55_01235 [Oceanicola sp. D3]
MSLAPDSLPTADGVASACALKLKATAQQAALVQLTLTAPCNGGQPVTVKHGPLSFTDITANDGTFTVTVPALSATAAFEARFDSGERAFAMTLVEGLDDHRRVALTWQGNIGLALHALEKGAEYDTGGHISAAHPATASRALSGEGGFLTVLGSADLPGARMAEVYSYPAALEGEVQLNVEAAVTEATCGAEMSANILSLGIKGYASHALTATMPGCDAVGEHLMFFDVQPEVRLASAE